MFKSFLPLAVVALFFAGVVTVSASHAWGNYHWARNANPFSLTIGDSVTPAWDNYLNGAISDWDVATELALVKATGINNLKPKLCKAVAGRVEVCNERYGRNGWLGIAQIWTSGDHITQATAKMNDSYFDLPQYNTPAWRRLVMCQEVAHDFGLDHQDEVNNNPNLGSCMDYTNDPDGGEGGASQTDPSNEHTNSHDFDQLSIMYAHLDSAVSALTSVSKPSVASVDEPSEWGKAVGKDASGRSNKFEQDLGKGKKVITHVFWAEEERSK